MSDEARRLLSHVDHLSTKLSEARAERDAAVAEAKVFEETSDFWEAQTSASNARWTEAVADRDRLAKALDLIGHGWDGDEFNDPADLVEKYASIALAALAGREGSDDA